MEQAISSDLIRGHIDTIILHSLIESDKYAQQISDSIEEKSNGEYKMIQATLYSSLKRLEGLKYVTSYWFDSEEANGRRKYFKITDLGKETVKNNLNNWSYSRALIDKLVDCAPQPIYKTQYVEKVIEVPKVVEVPVEKIVEVQVPIQNSPVISAQPENVSQTHVNLDKYFEDKSELNKVPEQTAQEINYKNILNGLIKSAQPKKQEKQTELEPVVKTETIQEKLKFNETIAAVDYNAQKNHNNGKIDFGDLVIKAAQEGYKVRISAKDSGEVKGKLLVNKLNLWSSLLTYLLFLIEFLVVVLTGNSTINFSKTSIILITCFATVFPIISTVIYFMNPNKRSNKLIRADLILTATIIVFNLILVTFAGNLIFGADLTDSFSLLVYFVLPSIVFVDIVIYFAIKYYLAKHKVFTVKTK